MIITRNQKAVDAALAQRLSLARSAAIDRITAATGAVRGRYITVAPGQDTIYARKAAEAQAVLTAWDAGLALPPAPLLMAEVRAGRVETLPQAAQVVSWLTAAWTDIASALEELRFRAGDAVEAASADDVAAVADGWIAAILAFTGVQT